MTDSKRVFTSGTLGSRWIGVCKLIGKSPRVDHSDEAFDRHYVFKTRGIDPLIDCHTGAFLGPFNLFGENFHKLQELTPDEIRKECDRPYAEPFGEKLRFHRCHQFAYHLDWLYETFPESRFMIVLLNPIKAMAWWLEVGGPEVGYPKYDYYKDIHFAWDEVCAHHERNKAFLEKHNVTPRQCTPQWILENFGFDIPEDDQFNKFRGDCLVTVGLVNGPQYRP
jgi:hypothetical protein